MSVALVFTDAVFRANKQVMFDIPANCITLSIVLLFFFIENQFTFLIVFFINSVVCHYLVMFVIFECCCMILYSM